MARIIANISATVFTLMLLFRALFTYIYPDTLPFDIAIIDWLVVASGSGAAISSIFCYIKNATPIQQNFYRCSAQFVM